MLPYIDVLNDSMVKVLNEHCGIGVDKQKVSRKYGRKIVPGQRIISVDREDALGSSKENASPLSRKRKTWTKVKQITIKNIKKIKVSEDIWICRDQQGSTNCMHSDKRACKEVFPCTKLCAHKTIKTP